MRKYQENQPVFIGIDVHKERWSVHVVQEGEKVFAGTLAAEPEQLLKILERYRSGEIHTVYEAGCFGFVLHRQLIAAGIDNIVVSPGHVPSASSNLVKTDRRDSQHLAYLLCKGLLQGIYIPSEEEEARRDLVRRREQLQQDRVRSINRIKGFLLRHGIKLSKPGLPKTVITQLQVLPLLPMVKEALHSLLEQFLWVSSKLDELDRLLVARFSTGATAREYAAVLSSPGVGSISAAVLVGHFYTLQRFTSERQISASSGLTPREHSSGERVRRGAITGQSNHHLRRTLVECAWIALRYDHSLKDYYDSVYSRCHVSAKAIVAVARKLLVRLWTVVRKNTTYQIPVLLKQEA